MRPRDLVPEPTVHLLFPYPRWMWRIEVSHWMQVRRKADRLMSKWRRRDWSRFSRAFLHELTRGDPAL